MSSGARTTAPVFVDGIGPPLQQIEDDYRYSPDQAARDALALIDEVYKLRAALGRFVRYDLHAAHWLTGDRHNRHVPVRLVNELIEDIENAREVLG